MDAMRAMMQEESAARGRQTDGKRSCVNHAKRKRPLQENLQQPEYRRLTTGRNTGEPGRINTGDRLTFLAGVPA